MGVRQQFDMHFGTEVDSFAQTLAISLPVESDLVRCAQNTVRSRPVSSPLVGMAYLESEVEVEHVGIPSSNSSNAPSGVVMAAASIRHQSETACCPRAKSGVDMRKAVWKEFRQVSMRWTCQRHDAVLSLSQEVRDQM